MCTRRKRWVAVTAAVVVVGLGATACSSGPESPAAAPPVAEDFDAAEWEAELEEALKDLEEMGDPGDLVGWDDFGTGEPLKVGDCWGRGTTVDHDPRSCTEPHVFEVVGVHEGFEAPEGGEGLDGMRAEQDAKDAICEGLFAEYFGVSYNDQPLPMILVTPEPVEMGSDRIVCSAYTTRSEEHTSPFSIG
ncbi:septum formation family protein [Streptomyces sp. ST2-7A]|uniref:septum formation family protein n=1 Tax=Streptomyces sp. ST2-7A TaxID=2907214 RepID=UPI001F33E30C|nr:septum formation family protein [Streptomyces sp. ST2-7A]MCE7083024.1 septum formation family protein [Streptomyces sp. ST2-7A]